MFLFKISYFEKGGFCNTFYHEIVK